MRGQCVRSVWAKKRGDHAHSRPIRCQGVPPFFSLHRSRMTLLPTPGPMQEASALPKTRNQFNPYASCFRNRGITLTETSKQFEPAFFL